MFVELPLAPITRSYKIQALFRGIDIAAAESSNLCRPRVSQCPLWRKNNDSAPCIRWWSQVLQDRQLEMEILVIALALSSWCIVEQKPTKSGISDFFVFFGGDPTWTNTIRRDSAFKFLDEVEEIPKESKACLAWPLSMAQVHASRRKMGSQIRILNISEPYIPTADVPSVNNGWVLRFHLGMCKDWASMDIPNIGHFMIPQ